jgi:hypothetical protein
MTALLDGTVLLPGADYHTDCNVKSAEIFTPGSNGGGTWALTGAMKATATGKAVRLDDGTVLVTRRDPVTQIYTP